jgi:hypothetical protein
MRCEIICGCAYLEQMIDFCEELCVEGETTEEHITRLGGQTLSKLTLKHQHGTPTTHRAQTSEVNVRGTQETEDEHE